ncbi:MAG: hypothetical protein IPL46_00065 [Saprospiraceae bacterium]|nr:hypothetical protein [Saprospiraceae bacterium]
MIFKPLIYVNDELGDDMPGFFQDIKKIGELNMPLSRQHGTVVYLCSGPTPAFLIEWMALSGIRRMRRPLSEVVEDGRRERPKPEDEARWSGAGCRMRYYLEVDPFHRWIIKTGVRSPLSDVPVQGAGCPVSSSLVLDVGCVTIVAGGSIPPAWL